MRWLVVYIGDGDSIGSFFRHTKRKQTKAIEYNKMFLRTLSWQAAFIELLPRRSVCYSVLHISLTVTSPQLSGLKRLE